MGLLRSSDCLDWEQINRLKNEIKIKGINQFINVYKYAHSTFLHEFIWGDEIELMACNDKNERRLFVDLEDVFSKFSDSEMNLNVEFAAYMIEMTPARPYNYDLSELTKIEKCMDYRIRKLAEVLKEKNSKPLLMTLFPKLGKYTSFDGNLKYDLTLSEFFPDNAITNHKRFFSFVKNIRNRRGKIIEGYIPIMKKESNHALDFVNINEENLKSECIKIDSMGQGMGCCCLQLTLQASTMIEARILYDMLGALCPLFLRLTRATPLSQGKLLATETRWDMLVFSVDCRTDKERGCKYNISGMKDKNTGTIAKSRFSSIDMYISQDENNLSYYNDINPPLYKAGYNILIKNNVDDLMARHISSLFIRDPILVYKSEEENTSEVIIECDLSNKSNIDGKSGSFKYPIFYTDDFENIQSSNWRSMRFKLPAQNGSEKEKGWKIEVRPMEIQPTAFENASWCIFVVLLSRSIVEFKVNFYIPLSLVDENFRRANLLYNNENDYLSKIPKDKALFYYRTNIFDSQKAIVCEGTVEEIFMGNSTYEGIYNLVIRYVKNQKCEQSLSNHLEFIKKRLSDELLSVGDFIRRFVIRHNDYLHDSNVPENVIDDLINEISKATENNNVDYLKNSV